MPTLVEVGARCFRWRSLGLGLVVATSWCSIGAVAVPTAAAGGVEIPSQLRLGNPTGQVVSNYQAQQITAALWPLREQALATDDIATTDQLEDGVAREFDDAVSIDDRARPHIKPLRRARSYSELAVFVPRQSTYPAAFLAEVLTSVYATVPSEGSVAGTPYVEFLVVTRRDASSSWKVSLDTGYASTVMQSPPTDMEGLDTVPPATFVDPGAMHAKLADYWQHWKDTGTPPADGDIWAPGYWTTQRAATLAEVRNRTPDPGCRGCVPDIRYRADPADGLWSFSVIRPDGRPARLVCSTVRIVHRSAPGGRGRLLRQDGRRDNWGGWLAPGWYSSITSDAVRQSCIRSGPARADGLAVLGGNGETVSVHGTKATPGLVLRLRFPRGAALPFLLGGALVVALVVAGAARSRRPVAAASFGSPLPMSQPAWYGAAPPTGATQPPFTPFAAPGGVAVEGAVAVPGRRARRRRWPQAAAVGIGLLGVALRIGVAARSLPVGLGSGLALVGLLGWLAVVSRRQAERRLASLGAGPLVVNALLDFSCLPGAWPGLARETLPAAAAQAPGLSVTLAITDGYLTLQRRRAALTGKTPFAARVALRSIRDIRVGRAQLTLNGTSLTFDLASGEELRVDLGVGAESAQRVVAAIRDEVNHASGAGPQRPTGIEITSSPPPVRTPPATAGLLMMAFLAPWFLAMIGAHNGAFAAITLTGGLFVALGLTMKRPPSMPSILARVMGIGAASFVVDAVRLGQPLRLTGTALCLLLTAWIAKHAPSTNLPPSLRRP